MVYSTSSNNNRFEIRYEKKRLVKTLVILVLTSIVKYKKKVLHLPTPLLLLLPHLHPTHPAEIHIPYDTLTLCSKAQSTIVCSTLKTRPIDLWGRQQHRAHSPAASLFVCQLYTYRSFPPAREKKEKARRRTRRA